MYRLENWSICDVDMNPYIPPDKRILHLQGNVYNHPNFVDGNGICTSPIVSVSDGIVITKNSTYLLGEPDPKFLEWCKENGHHVPTKEEPIKLHKDIREV